MVWSRQLVLWFLLSVVQISKADDLDRMLQLYPRVAVAASRTDSLLRQLCSQHQLSYPPRYLLLRGFKKEKELELWASDGGTYDLLKVYPICMLPGKPGPKIRQGDKQVPEGIYEVDTLNPESEFHLSFRINYPNQADLIRSSREKDPGGDIYIHGDCVSVGCLPMGDEFIEELFWLVALHQSAFPDHRVQVHLFPFRMDRDDFPQESAEWHPFWRQLRRVYEYFGQKRELPAIVVNEKGEYMILR